jgi:hypothetical protein
VLADGALLLGEKAATSVHAFVEAHAMGLLEWWGFREGARVQAQPPFLQERTDTL